MTEAVLGVFAHPDDEALLAGGTLAACAAAGLDVTVVCVTAGELGGDPDTRRAELAASGEALGIARAECLGYPDGELESADEAALVRELVEMIDERPTRLLLTFTPDGLYWHPDHLAVHRFAAAAHRLAARRPWAYGATLPAGLMPRLVRELQERGLAADLWGLDPEAFGTPAESIAISIDVRPFLERKLRALRSHASQFGPAHVVSQLPDDLAAELLGKEYLVKLL
jgi:N-acetyl-1-D-myo-inositol-2-amino-2-deoxy-alpha-D-glucopyranoside deacetylase